VYGQDHPDTQGDIWIRPLDGSGKPAPLINSKADENDARISPDGRWLAYHSDGSGKREVYVRPFPAGNEQYQVSIDGGFSPKWAPDGRVLYFVAQDRLMAAPITAASGFASGPPASVSTGKFDVLEYEVAGDGRILLIRHPPDTAPVKLNVVLNWLEELKRRVRQ
jgi:eukaryotic-like serine/threonine-protein kinase